MPPEPFYADDFVTLYHGDTFDLLPEVCPDPAVIVTDPPYGIAYASGQAKKLAWSNDIPGAQYEEKDGAIEGDGDTSARDDVLTMFPGVPAIMFGSLRAPFPPGWHTCLVWDKGESCGMGDLSVPWKPSWEPIFVIGKGFAGHRGSGVLRSFVPSRVSMGRVHPTEKPVSLMEMLLAKCPKGGTVLDPFCGSGPTLRAAKNLGLKVVGIERVERYARASRARCSQENLFGGDDWTTIEEEA